MPEDKMPISEVSEPIEQENREELNEAQAREDLVQSNDELEAGGELTQAAGETEPSQTSNEEVESEGEPSTPFLLGVSEQAEDRIPISQFSVPVQLNNDDVVVIVQDINGVKTTYKAPLTLLATHLLKVMQFASDLDTANKTIISAINELVGGAGVSSLSALTDVTIVSPSNGQVLTYDATSGKWVNGAGAELALTSEVIGSICSFNDGSDGQPVKSWKTTITPIQAGSGTPAPDNIRALSARTQIVATKTKANLLGGSKLLANAQAYISGTTDTENKTFTFSASTTPDTSKSFTGDVTYKFKENTRYTFIITGSGSSSTPRLNLRVYYTDGTYSAITNPSTQNVKETVVFVSTAGKTVRSLNKYTGSGTTTLYYDECGIFEGVVGASDFEAYDAVSKTISLGTSVVGGELDITGGGAKSDILLVTFDGSEDWATNGTSGVWLSVSGLSYLEVAYCNMFEPLANGTSGSMGSNQIRLNTTGTNLLVKCPDAMTGDAFKALLQTNNLQVGFRVTPTAIVTQGEAFNTAAGENQFYTDCGVSDVVYFNSMVDDVVDICDEVIASKTKILTGTLSAGSTTITFTDSALTSDCTKNVYVDDAFFGVAPTAMVADYVNHSVTYTFPAQASNMPVKLEVR